MLKSQLSLHLLLYEQESVFWPFSPAASKVPWAYSLYPFPFISDWASIKNTKEELFIIF